MYIHLLANVPNFQIDSDNFLSYKYKKLPKQSDLNPKVV